MGSSTREEVREDFDVLRAAVSRVVEHSYDALTTPERLALLERLEQETRRLGVPGQQLINQLGAQAGDEELGGTLRRALADRLRITKAEAGQRIEEAEDLGERRALTGEPLAPQLSATAAGQRRGLIGEGHIKVIRSFFGHLPAEVDLSTREADLAGKARTYCPDELAKYARRVMDWLHPDGEFNDVQGCRPPGAPISTTSHWPAGPITGSPNRAGPPAPTPAATPNGSRHPTSTTDNHEPTPTTTPNDSDTTTKIRSPQGCQTDLRWKLRRSGMLKT